MIVARDGPAPGRAPGRAPSPAVEDAVTAASLPPGQRLLRPFFSGVDARLFLELRRPPPLARLGPEAHPRLHRAQHISHRHQRLGRLALFGGRPPTGHDQLLNVTDGAVKLLLRHARDLEPAAIDTAEPPLATLAEVRQLAQVEQPTSRVLHLLAATSDAIVEPAKRSAWVPRGVRQLVAVDVYIAGLVSRAQPDTARGRHVAKHVLLSAADDADAASMRPPRSRPRDRPLPTRRRQRKVEGRR